MTVFKSSSSLGIAILLISCGGSVDAGNSTTDNVGGLGDTTTTGGSHRGGAAPAAGGSTQVNVVAPSGTGGTAGSSYSGGLTPVTFDTSNPVLPNTASGCGREFRVYNQSSCTYAVSLRTNAAGGFDNSSSVEVIYSVSDSMKSALLIGQSQPNCLQGDGWYLETGGNITLCPQTCTTVQQDPTFVISIVVGCQNSIDCPCPGVPDGGV